MIIISLMPTNEEAERLQQTGVPIVLVDTHHPNLILL
jgi:DNA-binding LacI/PurR family transcriptional regulator